MARALDTYRGARRNAVRKSEDGIRSWRWMRMFWKNDKVPEDRRQIIHESLELTRNKDTGRF